MMHRFRSHTHTSAQHFFTGGFTLVELLVTLSIVILATGLVMVRYVSFNSSVLLNNAAYQLAFDLRETQSLAVSVRGSTDRFYEEYGLYFDMDKPNQYILFLDRNNSARDGGVIWYDYDEDPDYDEAVGEPIIIDPRFTIENICYTPLNSSTVRLCYSDQGGPNFINIAFARPDFDAVMSADGYGRRLGSVEIILGTGADDGSDVTRSVIITDSGQITVR